MDPNISNTMDPTGDKRLPETGVHTNTVSHNITIQKNQHHQTVGNITTTNVSGQNVVNAIASSCNTIVGEKLPFIKSNVQSGSTQFSAERKITPLCSVGQPVRIISPGTLTNVERQTTTVQGQTQQIQGSQQVVTTLSTTYHVPRGPATVANIATPRSTVATPIVRATGQPALPITRPGVNTTVSNPPQWTTKTSLVYAQPPRHPVSRITTRPPAVYSAQPARIVTPNQVRPPVQSTTIVQPTVVATVTTGAPTRLLTPVLQTNNAIARIPGSQVRPTGPQITNPIVQPIRNQTQTIQTNQIVRSLPGTTTTTNRVTVAAPVVATASRITSVTTSGTVQPAVLNRQLTINSSTGPTQTTFSRVVIPTQALQQVQPSQIQGHSINTTRVVQAITSLPSTGTMSRVITTSNSSNTRVTQSQQAPVGRLTGMTLHSLPLSRPQATTTTTVKTVPGQIQLKTNVQPLRVTSSNIPSQLNIPTTTVVTTSSSSSLLSTPPPPPSSSSSSSSPSITATPTTATIIINNTNINTNNINNNSNNNINSPTQLSQGSMYAQYRQVSTPLSSTAPMRLTSAYIVESSHDDTHGKPNASPRPSILRKRDHDNSPGKNIAKNLAPALALIQASPPLSPRRDRESGNQSSGSTTVSATSSPGLDDEPEQSRITIINQTMEMSPRKKPRKQQLTGVELPESRCTEEEMQFITEDKIKRDTIKDNKYCINRKTNLHLQNDNNIGVRNPTVIIKPKPTQFLLDSSWKSRCNSRLHHYRRPSDVRPKEERRPTVAEISQQKHVLQKINGWKVYQLTAQMEDLAELEKQVHERFKAQLVKFESLKTNKNRQDDGNDSEKMLSDRVNELIKGNMQRSSLISEGISEARSQLITIFQHKSHVNDILQRCGNKRSQKSGISSVI